MNIEKRVQFISYSPLPDKLCKGVLRLKINNKEVNFGAVPGGYPIFWESGGSWIQGPCVTGKVSDLLIKRPWIIHKYKLPLIYQDYYDEIKQVFNENVPYGCCEICLVREWLV